MYDELTNIITSFLVENQTECLDIPARNITRNTNVQYIISEHIREMSQSVDRCIQQYIAKTKYPKAPAIPAMVRYLEFDKSEMSYALWGEEDFNLAYVLNLVNKAENLDPNDQDSLWCMHHAKNLALVHWDGCEFELEYDDEDYLNYLDWREINETGRPIYIVNDNDTTVSVFDNDIRISFKNIGEGLNGDYDETDENDVNLLRIKLYTRNYDVGILEWTERIGDYELGLSSCTQIPATTSNTELLAILKNIYPQIRNSFDNPETALSLKHLIGAASWLSPSQTTIPDLYGIEERTQ